VKRKERRTERLWSEAQQEVKATNSVYIAMNVWSGAKAGITVTPNCIDRLINTVRGYCNKKESKIDRLVDRDNILQV
jgi:hypothetical protein